MWRNIYIGYEVHFVDPYPTILMWRPLYSFITVLDSLAKHVHDRLETIYLKMITSLRRLAAFVEVRYLLERILGEHRGFARLRYACMEDVESFLARNGFRLAEKEHVDDVVSRDFSLYIGRGVKVEIHRKFIGASLQPTEISWKSSTQPNSKDNMPI